MIDADKPRLIIDADKLKNRVMMRYAIDKNTISKTVEIVILSGFFALLMKWRKEL